MALTLGDAILYMRGDSTGLDKDLGNAEKKTQGWAGRLGKALGGVIVAGAAAAVAGIGAIGAAAVSVAIEYDKAQDKLIAATGASGDALDEMSKSVVALHGGVAGLDRSMTDVAAVMGEVSTRTGATGPALDEFTEQILKMTRITGDDGVAAVAGITRVMGDWNIPLEDSSLLMDKLFGAGQKWGIGLDSLAGKLVQFGAPMRLMGFSMDESINLLGKWEQEGVNTEIVMGSLRIAAGHYARASAEVTETTTGGVKSMAEAQATLDKLRGQMQIAILQEEEFSNKTKESARLAKRMQIDNYTAQIAELEAAMALGEFQTVQNTAVNRDLAASFAEDIEAIKGASTAQEALNLGMEIFGAKAGPDMVAAIREGRFEIGDATAVMNGMVGSIDDVTLRSMGLEEKWQIAMTGLKNSLLPVGEKLMELGMVVMPFVETSAGKLSTFLGETLPSVMDTVKTAWNEDWAGMRSTTTEFTDEVPGQVDTMWAAIKKVFGIGTQDTESTWGTWLNNLLKGQYGFVNLAIANVTELFTAISGVQQMWDGIITGDWQMFWDGLVTVLDSTTNGILNTIEYVFGAGVRDAIAGVLNGVWDTVGNWLKTFDLWLKTFNDKYMRPGSAFAYPTPAPIGVNEYASGTSYARGGLSLVGEQGPELVNLPRGSRVWNADDTRNMMGGEQISVTIHQNFAGPADAPTVYRAAGAGAMTVQQLRRRRGG